MLKGGGLGATVPPPWAIDLFKKVIINVNKTLTLYRGYSPRQAGVGGGTFAHKQFIAKILTPTFYEGPDDQLLPTGWPDICAYSYMNFTGKEEYQIKSDQIKSNSSKQNRRKQYIFHSIDELLSLLSSPQ